MKINVLRYTVSVIQSFDDAYMRRYGAAFETWSTSEQAKWLGLNKIKVVDNRHNDYASYQMLHVLTADIDGPLLTEYLLRFGSEPHSLEGF